jgi:hypothetical protein
MRGWCVVLVFLRHMCDWICDGWGMIMCVVYGMSCAQMVRDLCISVIVVHVSQGACDVAACLAWCMTDCACLGVTFFGSGQLRWAGPCNRLFTP